MILFNPALKQAGQGTTEVVVGGGIPPVAGMIILAVAVVAFLVAEYYIWKD